MKRRTMLLASVAALTGGALAATKPPPSPESEAQPYDGLDDASRPMMDEARQRIEAIRKGDCTVRFVKPDGSPASGKASIRLAKHEFWFGANLTSVMLLTEDNPVRAKGLDAIADLFNMVRIGDNWGVMEPERGGPLHWEAADRDLAWAQSHDMTPRYHALLYVFKNMPAWSAEVKTPEEWWPLIERRIQAVAERYGDSVLEFEVINEMISSRSWLKTALPAFPPLSDPKTGARLFEIARQCLPKAILVSLEAGVVTGSPTDAYFNSIYDYHKDLIALGASVDAIGNQAHFFPTRKKASEIGPGDKLPRSFSMKALEAGFDRLATLGKPIHVTEFSAPSRSNVVKGPQSRFSDKEIAAWSANFYTLLFSKPYMRELVCWNLIDGVGGQAVDAGVLAGGGEKKPLYRTLRKLIKEDWSSSWEGNLSRQGGASFRGFFGTYEASVGGKGAVAFTMRSGDSREIVVHL